MAAQDVRDGGELDLAVRRVGTRERELEGELVEPVGAGDVERAAARRRAARAASRARRAARPHGGVVDARRGELRVEVGRGEVGALEHAVHEGARARAALQPREQRGRGQQRRLVERGRRDAAAGGTAPAGGSSVSSGASGSLATRASARVPARRSPPAASAAATRRASYAPAVRSL